MIIKNKQISLSLLFTVLIAGIAFLVVINFSSQVEAQQCSNFDGSSSRPCEDVGGQTLNPAKCYTEVRQGPGGTLTGYNETSCEDTTDRDQDGVGLANGDCDGGSFLGLPKWYKYLEMNPVNGECQISFDITKDVPKILLAVFEILLRVAGMVAVIFVIVGGFQYILTQGEPDKAKAAKGTIVNALIGLVIAILASTIVNFLARNIT